MSVAANQFVLVPWSPGLDGARLSLELCAQEPLCDGLLIYRKAADGAEARMWNPDGSEDFCANGLACVAWLAGYRRSTLRTPWRAVQAEILDRAAGRLRLRMGLPEFRARHISTTLPTRGRLGPQHLLVRGRRLRVFVLSIGTPHCVIPVSRIPGKRDFLYLSQAIERHPAFPQRTSVLWVARHGPRALTMRIWERGVGETAGCGTGAVAAALVASRDKHGPQRLTVRTCGGCCQVLAGRFGPPFLTVTVDPARQIRNVMDIAATGQARQATRPPRFRPRTNLAAANSLFERRSPRHS